MFQQSGSWALVPKLVWRIRLLGSLTKNISTMAWSFDFIFCTTQFIFIIWTCWIHYFSELFLVWTCFKRVGLYTSETSDNIAPLVDLHKVLSIWWLKLIFPRKCILRCFWCSLDAIVHLLNTTKVFILFSSCLEKVTIMPSTPFSCPVLSGKSTILTLSYALLNGWYQPSWNLLLVFSN